jgi:hypothetical protein
VKPYTLAPIVAVLAFSVCAAGARAVDGVVEINQAKAMAGGVTPGDSPGFPVEIYAGGSYRLTSNLDVAAGGQGSPENLHGIVVSVASEPKQVDIDLNGFTLLGPVTCSYSGKLECSANASGTGIGIYVGQAPLRLHDGVIQGFATHGVNHVVDSSSQTAQMRNLDLRWNLNGIVTAFAVIENVTTTQNRGQGLYAFRSVLRRIFSQHNGNDGIAIEYSVLDDCVSSQNVGDGVNGSEGSLVRGCRLYDNGQYGLACSSNDRCGYAGNTINLNDGGTVLDGIELGPNLCEEDLTCP